MSDLELTGFPVDKVAKDMRSDVYAVAQLLRKSGWDAKVSSGRDSVCITITTVPHSKIDGIWYWENVKGINNPVAAAEE